MFKYTEKVGELTATYEADTAQDVADLVNIMNDERKSVTTCTSNTADDSVVIGPLS